MNFLHPWRGGYVIGLRRGAVDPVTELAQFQTVGLGESALALTAAPIPLDPLNSFSGGAMKRRGLGR